MSLKISLSLSLSQNYLTEKNCVNAISLRGLLRIWCSLHISSVLNFLTLHGFVNHGFLDDIPRPLPFPQSDKKVPLCLSVAVVTDAQIRVLVIGAGTAGIAAVRNYGHSVSPHTLTPSQTPHTHTHNPAGEDPGGEWVSRREGQGQLLSGSLCGHGSHVHHRHLQQPLHSGCRATGDSPEGC